MRYSIKLFLLPVIFFQLQLVYAQENYVPKNLEDAISLLGGRIRTNSFNFVYDGSPYLNEEFLYGELFYNHELKFINIPIRYNILYDEIEYKRPDKETTYSLGADTLFDMIYIPEDTFIVALYEKDMKMVPGFFKLVTSGNATLLIKMEVEFREATSETTHEMAMDARFINKPDQYFIKKTGQPAEYVKNVKKLISQLGNHEEELANYSKKNKLSSKKEKDLQQLIDYYNSF
jgi:hypothetical protein